MGGSASKPSMLPVPIPREESDRIKLPVEPKRNSYTIYIGIHGKKPVDGIGHTNINWEILEEWTQFICNVIRYDKDWPQEFKEIGSQIEVVKVGCSTRITSYEPYDRAAYCLSKYSIKSEMKYGYLDCYVKNTSKPPKYKVERTPGNFAPEKSDYC